MVRFAALCLFVLLGARAVRAQCPAPDLLEPNDTCATAALVGPIMTVPDVIPGLGVSTTDEDWFAVDVPVAHDFFLSAFETGPNNFTLSVELFDACGGLLISSSSGFVSATNLSAVPMTFLVRVSAGAGASPGETQCYSLDPIVQLQPCLLPDDGLGGLISPGFYTGLTLVPGADNDSYQIDLQDGDTLTASAFGTEDVSIAILEDCATAPFDETSLNGTVTHTNRRGDPVRMRIRVVPAFAGTCSQYDLTVSVTSAGPTVTGPYCFGNQSSACPCLVSFGPSYPPGGCPFDFSFDGAILSATGTPSLAGDTLHFELTRCAASSFGVLVSGLNKLPQVGPCAGTGIPLFDGLRCVGGDFMRHGARATDAGGNGVNGWGPPDNPTNGIAAQFGFSAGQARNFQVFFRTDASQPCSTGQSSSNAYHVVFQP